jgi:hypothetical protein
MAWPPEIEAKNSIGLKSQAGLQLQKMLMNKFILIQLEKY